MSWDYVCDQDGCLEILVSRWYNKTGKKESLVSASGFEPYEPVQLEVFGKATEWAVKPFETVSE